ncbi:CPBP family intramembrane metalloprotease domain-containing protein [Natronococcus pandeyae]|uniref:CPBP family intramembrane metalloprotease domain-containing protein n=1 Tax=Natronococcus pandeyae TaxID=2055836 RepID=A0A8J8Q897_9EURY|nr:CPBP family glutamic-type intramembrane protease [Natronococcus pandeyae]TYL40308.1 CPBP family intramembrane metalloprotease domain-containing protein [Natronococcus pandeyae]
MADWTAFAAITGVVLALLLVLSTLTQSAFEDADLDTDSSDDTAAETTSGTDSTPAGESPDSETPSTGESADSTSESVDATTGLETDADGEPAEPTVREQPRADDRGVDPESLTTGMVLANVAASQGLFALVLLGAVVYTGVPADALGIEFSRSYLETGLLLGTAFGLVLYVANELGAATATRFGFDHDEQLRELLAPESIQGWLVLLGVVLPIIAVFEELLFRAALIGALSVGFGISPWLLAVVSSVAFAIGHGMQGSVGIVVTGVLGFVLAAIYIVTGSFLVVVVAHYFINALEFVVHEGLEFEWAETLES